VETITLVLGGVLTLAGAAGLVVAFRHAQAGRHTQERRWFVLAVAALALGSLGFLATVLLAG
jgi:hypothetical protein